MSGENDPTGTGEEPIDAQFEPAPPVPDHVTQPEDKPSRPGWIALGVTGVAAAFVGALLGNLSGIGGNGNYAPQSVVDDVQLVAEEQLKIGSRLAALKADLASAETELKQEINAAAAASGDADALAALTADIQALSDQFEAIEVGDQEVGEIEGLQLDEVNARLEALERADEDDVTSPRLANRAITALRREFEKMEEEDEARREAVQELFERVASIELVLNDVETPSASVDPEVLQELKAEIEALQARQTEEAGERETESERLTRWVQELREKEASSIAVLEDARGSSDVAIAMLSIEAAARDGRPFQAAYAKLAKALPGNASVVKLRSVAATGAPTFADLQGEFAKLKTDAETMVSAENTQQDGWGWVRKAFGDSVTVRRSGGPDKDEFENTIATAEQKLAVRDLEGVISAVETLPADHVEIFQPWLDHAKDRQKLEDGLDQLRLTLMGAER